LLILVKGLPLAYNRDLQEDKPPLFDSFDTVRACLELAIPIVQGAELRREAILARLDKGYLDATTLMEHLILLGIPQRTVSFDRSAWVAVRILPSLHTNPIFVIVDGQEIRASRRSAQWCRDAVDVCWSQKRERIRGDEIGAAKAAYDQARSIYAKIVEESQPD
jgi:argininosuccinate lyase